MRATALIFHLIMQAINKPRHDLFRTEPIEKKRLAHKGAKAQKVLRFLCAFA